MDAERRTLIVALALTALGQPAFAETRYRDIPWEDLVPPDWKPERAFRMLTSRIGKLLDGSPEALELEEKMRKIWDEAPTTGKWTGQPVRLPGFVVPLDADRDALREFLLVPYFGACIHSPPPPANQIVHVTSERGLTKMRTMDTVWVEGVLSERRRTSEMGVSGYAMRAHRVYPYKEK